MSASDFRLDLILRTPNTLDAHRLIWLAGREGVQDAVMEAVFVAYFTQGRDIGDHDVLADCAALGGHGPRRGGRLPGRRRGCTRRCWPPTAPRARPA